MLFLFAVGLTCSPAWAATQPAEGPYGKTVREIRLPELEWTQNHVILRELGSKVGEVYTREPPSWRLGAMISADAATEGEQA